MEKFMACGNNVHPGDQCVCAVLRAIADAQDQVSPVTGGCEISCERSIQELLNGVSPATTAPNTIPVILYCGCEPFLGTGVSFTRRTPPGGGTFDFECIQTFVFRVTSVDNNCCAVLELLQIVNAGGQPIRPSEENVCSQFGAQARDFERTGICITVDLNCFCAVTCLEPITL
jgi:hypothetical protein